NGNRCSGVIADDLVAFLQFSWSGILKPEEVKRLQLLAEAACFNGRQAMMTVVEQMQIVAKSLADARKQFWNLAKIRLGSPLIFWRQAAPRGRGPAGGPFAALGRR